MTESQQPETDELLRRVASGDRRATGELLARHRERLRQMLEVNMDPRLAQRLDPSDVIQESLAEAATRLPDYVRERPLPFYPWLRQIAFNRMLDLHRRHVLARKRSVKREEPLDMALSDQSVLRLANRLVGSGSSPSRRMIRQEQRAQVRAALEQLPLGDREVLVMRHLEQLSNSDIAAILKATEEAVKVRHFRAVERLQRILHDE